MTRLIFFNAILLLFVTQLPISAQVTIGSDKEPEHFSALELVPTTGGLRLPHLNTLERDKLLLGKTNTPEAMGLTVFNTDTKCLEFYKDEFDGWINLCDQQNIENIPLDQQTILRPYTVADGNIVTGMDGKHKYDVAQVNSGGSCGTLSEEGGRSGDFKNSNDFIRNYVIDFSSITGVSDLKVGHYQDPYGIIESVTGDVEGNLSEPQNKVMIKMIDNINILAKGLKEHNALKATIYGIFLKDGLLKRTEYTITVMDCLGCGVRITADQQWIPTMCYNLGADESKNPFKYNPAIEGDSYQWGSPADGHHLKNSPIFYPDIPLGKIDYPTVPLDQLDSDGLIVKTSPRYGMFIPANEASEKYFYDDWSVEHSQTIWGDGTQRLVVRKGIADPCPDGFRLPTLLEMKKIQNELIVQDTLNGAKVQADGMLFLPYSSFRNSLGDVSSIAKAYYWTSSVCEVSNKKQVWSLELSNSIDNSNTIVMTDRNFSASVRCIVE